jgi:hypothetical protein
MATFCFEVGCKPTAFRRVGLSPSNLKMGLAASSSADDTHWEQPSEKHDATLYYFAGRGLADQLRWIMAATGVSFTQKLIIQRGQFERLAKRQLPFGQLPLLQIDGLEIVQSQAAVRYLARRAQLQGKHCLKFQTSFPENGACQVCVCVVNVFRIFLSLILSIYGVISVDMSLCIGISTTGRLLY